MKKIKRIMVSLTVILLVQYQFSNEIVVNASINQMDNYLSESPYDYYNYEQAKENTGTLSTPIEMELNLQGVTDDELKCFTKEQKKY